jgi:hypothetical protein
MNKNVEPSASSIRASVWFAEYLQKKLEENPRSAPKLAKAIGMERKSIYDFALLKRSPKLEIVAKILAYYGEEEINIPISPNLIPCSYCRYFHQINPERMTGYCRKHGKETVGENYCRDAKERS